MDFYSNLDSRLLDRQTPTLFEIVSAKELEDLLSPSVRYILVHYAQRYPRYLLKVLNHFDELNLAVRGLCEYNYLKNWNSTFIEKFYGLKRTGKPAVSVTEESAASGKFEKIKRLSKLQIFACMLEVAGVPYLSSKMDLLYEKLLPSYLTKRLKPKESYKDLLKTVFVRIYPTLKLLLKVADVVFKVLFISGKFKSASLIQALFKVQYSRLNQYDYSLDEARVEKFLAPPHEPTDRVRPESMTESLVSLYSKATIPFKKASLYTANSVLPISIFLLRFLEWWNSSGVASTFTKEAATKKTPPPPQLLPRSLLTDDTLSQLKTTTPNCRLCHRHIDNPAIIETGYVFCHPCIYNYLRDGSKDEGGRCPVTGKRLLGCKWSDAQNQWKVTNVRRLML